MTETDLQEPNVWAQRLISLLLILLGISFAGILILGSYYNQPVTQSLSFLVQDSEQFDSGLGIHSFRDFQEIRYALPTAEYPDVWTNSNFAHTPSALIPNIVAKKVQEIFGMQVSLIFYLIALAIFASAPAIWVAKKTRPRFEKVLVFLLLSVFAQPFIMTIDRGNSVGFILPFLMMFSIGIFYCNNLFAVIGILGAFSFRPQFALLGLVLVVCRLYKHTFVTIFSGATIFFGSFMFMPLSYSDSINSWLDNLKMFSRKYDNGLPFPVNLSAKTSFGGVFDGSNYSIVSGVILFLVLLVFSVFYTCDQKGRMLTVVMSLPCLVPSLSFGYYSIFVLVIAAMIFAEPKFLEPTMASIDMSNSRRQIKTRVAYNYLLITVVAVSLAPIPFVREVGRNSIALESFSTLWTIVLFATLTQQIIEHYNAKVAA